MKKIVSFAALTLVLIIMMCSCSQGADTKAKTQGKTVSDVLNEQADETTLPEEETKSTVKSSSDKKKAEVDLTELSSTMVYSEVFNMMSEPENYIGKTVRMNGTLDVYKDGDKTYYACIIKDAAACCAQGIEFVLGDGSKYPKSGSEVTVYGTFDTYKEDVYTYCQLLDAELEA